MPSREERNREAAVEALARLRDFTGRLVKHLEDEGHKVKTKPVEFTSALEGEEYDHIVAIDGTYIDWKIRLYREGVYQFTFTGKMYATVEEPAWSYGRKARTKTFPEPKKGFVVKKIGGALLDHARWRKEAKEARDQEEAAKLKAEAVATRAKELITAAGAEDLADDVKPRNDKKVRFELTVTPEVAAEVANLVKKLEAHD
jgi:flavodoxin